ncbi:MAG: NADPH-dependent F420 reductase [Methanothrix sp.]|nr:NADPH-dependent F420 reductase [Methanothrix sp.]
MKIGIIGSGNVGSALGKIWGRNGHEILFSSRNPEKLKSLAQSVGKNAFYGLPADAVKFGEVVALAVPWGQAENALLSAGPMNGKILIDCTNPLKPDYSGLSVGGATSAAEEVARMARGAKVVKAFHTTFAALMQSDSRMFGSTNPTGFFCGDDAASKAVVESLIRETGLEPLDVGPLSYARYLEPMAMLMINLGFAQKMGTNIALKLLRR